MRWIVILFFLISAHQLIADQAPYTAEWDLYFSPYAGGEDLLFANHIWERGEKYFFRRAEFEYPKSAKARSCRLSELLTIWLPLNYEAMLIQHEIFGHGYRIRSLGSGIAKVRGYRLGIPPPYGAGGGATSYIMTDQLTAPEEMAISIAGVEATAILANVTKWKWLAHQRSLHAQESLLYLFNQLDLSDYISSMKTIRSHEDSGHDIHSYLKWLNRLYPEKRISSGHLRSLSWINALDPFLYYSAWALLHYISSGRDTKIPMIPIGKTGYLFSYRLGLTPFGPEIFWENYFATFEKVFYGYVKCGRHADNTYFGAGVYLPILTLSHFHIGGRCDLWRYPKIMQKKGRYDIEDADDPAHANEPLYSYSELHSKQFGAALSLIGNYQWNPTWAISTELGGKTAGFFPGYSLSAAYTLRCGLSVRF